MKSRASRIVEVEKLAAGMSVRTLQPRAVRCLFNLMDADAHPDTGAEALLLVLWRRGLVTRLYEDDGTTYVPVGWRSNLRGSELLYKVGAGHGQA